MRLVDPGPIFVWEIRTYLGNGFADSSLGVCQVGILCLKVLGCSGVDRSYVDIIQRLRREGCWSRE